MACNYIGQSNTDHRGDQPRSLDKGISLCRTQNVRMATRADILHQNIKSEIRHADHDIAVNMAKLAVILGDFTQNSPAPSSMDLPTYERYLHALEEWSSSLPQDLRVVIEDIDNVQQSELPNDNEFSSVRQRRSQTVEQMLTQCSFIWRHSTSPRS
jgi:hypothetical protein